MIHTCNTEACHWCHTEASVYLDIWFQSPSNGACWTLLSMKSWETPQSVWTTRTLGTLNSSFFTEVSPSLSRESNNKFNHLSPKWRGCKSLQMSTNVYFHHSDTVLWSESLYNEESYKKNHSLISHSNLLCICNNLHAIWNTVNTALTENVRPGTPNLLPVCCAEHSI